MPQTTVLSLGATTDCGPAMDAMKPRGTSTRRDDGSGCGLGTFTMSIPLADFADLPPPEQWANIAVRLACPRCAATGLIPVRQLDRALRCGACDVVSRAAQRVGRNSTASAKHPGQSDALHRSTNPTRCRCRMREPWNFRRYIASALQKTRDFEIPVRTLPPQLPAPFVCS